MTKTIFKNASKLLFGNIASSLLGLVFMAMLTRNLELEEYGLYVILIAYVGFLHIVMKINTLEPSIKYLANKDKSSQDIINIAFSIDFYNAIFSFVLMLLSISIFKYFYEFFIEDFYFYMLSLILVLISLTAGLLQAFLRVYDFFNITVTVQVFSAFLRVIFGYLFLKLGWFTLENIILLYVVSEVIINIYLVYILRNKMMHNKFTLNILGFKQLLAELNRYKEFKEFIKNMTLSKWFISVSKKSDVLVSGMLLGLEASAIYKIIKQITSILSKVIDPVYISIYPELAKAIKEDKKEQIKRTIRHIKVAISGVVSISMLLLIFFGEFFIAKIFGINLAENMMTLYLYFSGIGILFIFIYQHPLMLSYHMDKEILKIHIFTAIYFIVSLLVFLKIFGLLGVGITFLSYAIVESGIKYIVLKKLEKKGFK